MFDVAFVQDIRKKKQKDIINSSTNISALRLHQSAKFKKKSSTYFQMVDKTRDTWQCEYLPGGYFQQMCAYVYFDRYYKLIIPSLATNLSNLSHFLSDNHL